MPPAPCHAPDRFDGKVLGQVNGATGRWKKRIMPYSTSPNAAMTSATPLFTLKSRLSSAWPLPLVPPGQLDVDTSLPAHSAVPSPPVKPEACSGSMAQTFQFIEPEVSMTN